MPTMRTRRFRNAAEGIPRELFYFFAVGCGDSALVQRYGEAHLRAQWQKYGRQFLQVYPHADPWGVLRFGEPVTQGGDRHAD